MQGDASDSPDASGTRAANGTTAKITTGSDSIPAKNPRDEDASTLMPPPPPRPRPIPTPSLNPLLVGATVVSASGRNTNGTSTSTRATTTTTTMTTSSSARAAPAPLAKRSRKGKVPLEKGYSQVEWLRRARERVVSPPRDVTPDELALHSTPGDCWTALRGKVYDLTPYLRFHPGGVPLLEAVGGKDATAVFDAYHAWVNAGALLASCLVGRLAVDVDEVGGGVGEATRKKKAASAVVATVAEVEAAADAAEAAAAASASAAAAAAAEAANARANAASVFISPEDDAVR